MKIQVKIRSLALILLLSYSTGFMCQDNSDDDDTPQDPHKTKILMGFYVGSYFANKYSASTYNGYGFDVNGNRNTFLNSFMHQKIVNEYGGGYPGTTDQIAVALGVDPQQWTFTESDMPFNMHYTPAILVGFNFKIPLASKKNAIIVNLNGTKLNLQGNFTINTLKPQSTNPAFNSNQVICTITGREQRLLMQVGFQRIFGNNDKVNFFAEGGFIGTLAKFDRNTIYINTLQIDLTTYVNQTANVAPPPVKNPIGFGIGAFASIGLNADINPKFTLQLLYTLSHEKINIGTNPALKLQNGVGFRVYYNI